MIGLHSDIGGKFSNYVMEDVASILDIKLTTTAAYSPHQNGINEQNLFQSRFDDDTNVRIRFQTFTRNGIEMVAEC